MNVILLVIWNYASAQMLTMNERMNKTDTACTHTQKTNRKKQRKITENAMERQQKRWRTVKSASRS